MDVLYDFDDLLQIADEMQNASEPNYVKTGLVYFCSKKGVNEFAARFIPIFYYSIFVLSYLFNGLVLFILYKFEKLQTVTNIFLLNLVLSNLIFTSALPFQATYHQSEWVFGVFLCKVVNSAYFVGYHSAILFLTLMTFDRYLAVVHAITAAKHRKKLYAIVASIVVWLISVLASLREIIFRNAFEHSNEGLVCEDTGYGEETIKFWRLVTYYQQFWVFFLFPFFMIMYCYTSITVRILATRMKEKCRMIKLIFVIIFTFFACWTPYSVVCLLRAIQLSKDGDDNDGDDGSCATQDKLDYALYITRNLGYLYCCISPIFYSFVGKKFQNHFKRLISKHVPCVKRRLSLNSQSTRTTSQKCTNSAYE